MNAIIHLLRNNSTVTDKLNNGGDSIYVKKVPQSENPSYISITEDYDKLYHSKGAGATLRRVEYEIMIMGQDYADARAISDAIEGVLDTPTKGTYNGQRLEECRLLDFEDYGTIAPNRNDYMILVTYRATVGSTKENATATALDSFTYSNNDQTVASGDAITAMTATITSGAIATFSVDVNDSLPSGLTVNSSTGEITGTPSSSGSFDVVAVDLFGNIASVRVSVTVSGGATWQPSDMTNATTRIIGWWDLSEDGTVTYDVNNRIEQFNGRHAGGENFVQNTSDRRPYKSLLNGVRSGRWVGNNHISNTDYTSDWSPELNIFIVFQMNGQNGGAFYGFGSNPDLRRFITSETGINWQMVSSNAILISDVAGYIEKPRILHLKVGPTGTLDSKLLIDDGEFFDSGDVSFQGVFP